MRTQGPTQTQLNIQKAASGWEPQAPQRLTSVSSEEGERGKEGFLALRKHPMCACVQVCAHACVGMCLWVHQCACVCVCGAHMCMCISVDVYVCVRASV